MGEANRRFFELEVSNLAAYDLANAVIGGDEAAADALFTAPPSTIEELGTSAVIASYQFWTSPSDIWTTEAGSSGSR